MASFFTKAREALHELKEDTKHLGQRIEGLFDGERHSHTHAGESCGHLHGQTSVNCYHSFAPCRTGNDAKYYVDGCGYMWAVSVAIEEAHSQIWIMDWWLSPELYLRRPPSKNEAYRLDRMLLAAAERGVKVHIMIYKEVESVLTLNSVYTKHHLEDLHPNIAVLRHPDHNPSARVFESEVMSHFKSSTPYDLSKLSLSGMDDVVLFWAHHEKLLLVDCSIAFMGGLDLCFGRWDTNQHSIADAHPDDLKDIIFPGQDYNNARILDFQDVSKWEANKLDRTQDSRMGWTDLSISLRGPIIEDIGAHFVQRWNFIYNEKYSMVKGGRYGPLTLNLSSTPSTTYRQDGSNYHRDLTEPNAESNEDSKDESQKGPEHTSEEEGAYHHLLHHHGRHSRFLDSIHARFHGHDLNEPHAAGSVAVQMVRSSSKWSHGLPTEHSICNAYIEIIEKSQNFVYIENQFFITSTGDDQHPIANKIGKALVDRIVRAFKNNETYKIIVCMPAVPAFAGDLHDAGSLGTRAIMDFQYKSISRGGHSIIEMVEKAGVKDAKQYIRFYNLRNYDRINTSATMTKAEQQSGVSYEAARKEHDDVVGAGYGGRGEETGADASHTNQQLDSYQAATVTAKERDIFNTVSGCYMMNGPSLPSISWESTSQSSETEIDAFVSEELYIHSKVLIADDRIVIIGSANLNDRSQLGNHDSEIAVVIEDSEIVESQMAGKPHQAAKFATSMRRKIFRKHLGLIESQDCTQPDANFLPVDKNPNAYDWGSAADMLVVDPLSADFDKLWNGTAATNTAVFEEVFRPVPSNKVRNWNQYKEYYGQFFVSPSSPGSKSPLPAKYKYGHVFKEGFPGGVAQVKEELGKVRGTLVEMPLDFLCEVKNLAEFGIGYNAVTDDIYA